VARAFLRVPDETAEQSMRLTALGRLRGRVGARGEQRVREADAAVIELDDSLGLGGGERIGRPDRVLDQLDRWLRRGRGDAQRELCVFRERRHAPDQKGG
jgi:alkanesulfonate monooxygenase SsuD/methylene tetrahydromethanopterin reductase-like flavin-dependent oxidoreductase (luciferase family)